MKPLGGMLRRERDCGDGGMTLLAEMWVGD